MTPPNQKTAYAILEYISTVSGSLDAEQRESLDVASQCISEVFQVDLERDRKFSIKPKTLDEFVEESQKVDAGDENVELSDPSAVEAKADQLKSLGNTAMQSGDYKAAIAHYSRAIDFLPNKAIYFSNRAAAYSQVNEHVRAVEDAEKAIELDPGYARAYSRMGHAWYSLGEFGKAVDAYTKGLERDATNESMKKALEAAKAKLGVESGAGSGAVVEESSSTRAGETPSGGAGGAGLGGMNDMLKGLMSNPELMNNIMSNPGIRDLAQRMMGNKGEGSQGGTPDLSALLNNPQLMQSMASMFGGGGGAGSKPGN